MKNKFLLIIFFTLPATIYSQADSSLIAQLDSIYIEDQQCRKALNEVIKTHGFNSSEYKILEGTIRQKDSVNLVKTKAILDTHGWLGSDVVGARGNKTLFLVIQHSDQKTQETYLPMMKEAVKKGKASASSLALLEDRVALGRGDMQVYGSQVYRDSTGVYVDPIKDVDNVDKRRAEVGLPPLAEYLNNWKISWNIEQYKKDLPHSPAYKRWLAYKTWLNTQK